MNRQTVLSILISSSLFLVACQNDYNNSKNIPPKTPENTTTSISAADRAAYNGAIQLMDTKYCDKISTIELQQHCITELSDKRASIEALSQQDPSKCNLLSNADLTQACKIEVEIEVEKLNKEMARTQLQSEDSKKMGNILNSENYSACKTLQLPSSVQTCELTILQNKAISTKDITWCDKASIAEYIELCKQFYNISSQHSPTIE